MVWQQVYDPLHSMVLSTLVASVPVVVMLAGLGFFHLKAHIAAGAGLVAAIAIAVIGYGMPAEMAGKAAFLAATGTRAGLRMMTPTESEETPEAADTGPSP